MTSPATHRESPDPLPPADFPPPPLDPGDDLVTVITCASEFEASAKAAVLEEAGIAAFAFGGAQAALPLGSLKALRVPVQVRASDLDRAKAALADNKAESAGVDWDSVDVGEREDALPLKTRGRMPLVAFVGYLVAWSLVLAVVIVIGWWMRTVIGWG